MDNGRLNILIADDEIGIRESMAFILELEGYNVVTACNGFEAIESVKKFSCDIALIDIQMPIVNGVEAFRSIQKMSPQTTVVLMTAFAISDMVRDALREGAYACIEKPFEIDEFIKTLKVIKTLKMIA
ncbi:MAG: response regulator [Endomicrobiales bacterium]